MAGSGIRAKESVFGRMNRIYEMIDSMQISLRDPRALRERPLTVLRFTDLKWH